MHGKFDLLIIILSIQETVLYSSQQPKTQEQNRSVSKIFTTLLKITKSIAIEIIQRCQNVNTAVVHKLKAFPFFD